MFGYDVTVKFYNFMNFFYEFLFKFSGIIEAADPFAVGDFLFNPIVLVVAVGRAIAQVKSKLKHK